MPKTSILLIICENNNVDDRKNIIRVLTINFDIKINLIYLKYPILNSHIL